MIKLIWAQTSQGIIGTNGHLPWKIPEEMQHFRTTTRHHDVLMGRKTFESLNYQPLPQRFNYILSKQNRHKDGENFRYINDFHQLIPIYQHSKHKDLYVIGGKEVIKLFFTYADEIIVSIIKKAYPGTVKLEKLDWKPFKLTNTTDHAEFIIQYWQKK